MEVIGIVFIIGLIWWLLSTKPNKSVLAVKTEFIADKPNEDPQARHISNALKFARTQHKSITDKQREHNAWLHKYGKAKVAELDHLSGVEFEEFLAGLFREIGYDAQLTSVTGDYGADMILSKDGQRIAVQAKRYSGSVGVQAVQEALSGQAYYKCNTAWVVTTGTYTSNAIELAKKSGVRMIGRSEVGSLMVKHAGTLHNE